MASNTSRPDEADFPPAEPVAPNSVEDRPPNTGVTHAQLLAAAKVIEAEVNKVQARYRPTGP